MKKISCFEICCQMSHVLSSFEVQQAICHIIGCSMTVPFIVPLMSVTRGSLHSRRKKGRGEGEREGSACSKSLCFCITPTNFLVIRLRLLSIKCRYTRQSERKAEPCGYAEIYLICRELKLHKYLSKREILTSGQPEI